jgi:gas vesicle protein
MGYLRGVFHGAVLGATVALLYTPKRGEEMREELSRRIEEFRGKMEPAVGQAQSMYESARPTIESTVERARQRVGGKETPSS